jgi:hypothetical protein
MSAFDAVSRRAAESISRRRSLLTLGGAALGATLATPSASEAKKRLSCKEKEQRRCKRDADACKAYIDEFCAPNPAPECTIVKPCCENCSAAGFFDCVLHTSPS